MPMCAAKILVVEDDATIARFIELELAHEGYEVQRASDGVTALSMIGKSEPDLLILDLMLPNLDGIEVSRQLRREGRSFPILMLTARAETRDVVTGFDAGADDYLRKPFEIPELMSRVKVLLKRSESGVPASQYRASGIQVDTASRRVTVDGSDVELTAKEYELLEFFMANAGRVVTREEILDAVWDGQHGGDSNVIEVFVHHLRNKIGDRDNRIIQTVRGVGYFFARG
jgi:two-component system response regulator ArlR